MINKKVVFLITFVNITIFGMDQERYIYKTIVCSNRNYTFKPNEVMKQEATYLGLTFKEDPFVVMQFEDQSRPKFPVGNLESSKLMYIPTSHIIAPFGAPAPIQSQNGLFEILTQHKINNQFLVLCYDKNTKCSVMTKMENQDKSRSKRIKETYEHLLNKETNDNC